MAAIPRCAARRGEPEVAGRADEADGGAGRGAGHSADGEGARRGAETIGGQAREAGEVGGQVVVLQWQRDQVALRRQRGDRKAGALYAT